MVPTFASFNLIYRLKGHQWSILKRFLNVTSTWSLQDGTSNYLKGLMLILCYLIVAASFFVHIDPASVGKLSLPLLQLGNCKQNGSYSMPYKTNSLTMKIKTFTQETRPENLVYERQGTTQRSESACTSTLLKMGLTEARGSLHCCIVLNSGYNLVQKSFFHVLGQPMAIDVSLILPVVGADLVLSLQALANTHNLATRNARYWF